MICEDCGEREATRAYKTQRKVRSGANSYIKKTIHHVCEVCWNKLWNKSK